MSHTLNILTEDRPTIATVRATLVGSPAFELVTPDGEGGELLVVPKGVSWEDHRPIVISLGTEPDSELPEEYDDAVNVPDDLGECRYESSVDSGWAMTDAEAEVAAKIAVDLADTHMGYVDDPQGDGFLQGERDWSIRSIMTAYGAGVAAVTPLLATLSAGAPPSTPTTRFDDRTRTTAPPRQPFYRRKSWWILWAVCTCVAVTGKVARFEDARADHQNPVAPRAVSARDEPIDLPSYTLSVGADGCELVRTKLDDEPRGLTWHIQNLDGEDALERNALNEVRYRYGPSGSFVVALTAWDGEGYARVSNSVSIAC
jgi:hypothetical protein